MTFEISNNPESVAPPWIRRQLNYLLPQRGHAWLLHGPSGLGQYQLALLLARSWLCEANPEPDLNSTTAKPACGHCASCHAIDVRTHADLCVLMPEFQMLVLGWPLSEKAQADLEKKSKPSKEIRVEAMRDAIEFSQNTSARGRGKVVLVYPAEQMNSITANALLKTLEEPVGNVRFVLATDSAHQILPTIRSRCIGHPMQWPEKPETLAWLQGLGFEAKAATKALHQCGGRPEDALSVLQNPVAEKIWDSFPLDMRNGNTANIKELPLPELIDGLQKLCHDQLIMSVGGNPRFFEENQLSKKLPVDALADWSRQLRKARITAEHPFNLALAQEALVSQAKNVLNSQLNKAKP